MVLDGNLADVPITLGSLDPCFSCMERLETVDRKTHEVRVYSRAEILEMSRKRRRT
jgi:Ni,Fe-hydrogenase III large subunit